MSCSAQPLSLGLRWGSVSNCVCLLSTGSAWAHRSSRPHWTARPLREYLRLGTHTQPRPPELVGTRDRSSPPVPLSPCRELTESRGLGASRAFLGRKVTKVPEVFLGPLDPWGFR